MTRNILFIHHVSCLAGAERYLLSLVEALDKNYKVFFICQEPGPLSEALARHGVTVSFMPLRAWRQIRYLKDNVMTIRSIIDFCKSNRIDLICSNNYRVASYAVLPARCLGIPSVTIIQDFVPRHKLWKFNTFMSQALVTVSNSIAAPIRHYYRKDAVTIYNGIDSNSALLSLPPGDVLRSDYPLLKGKRIVGMVAHIIPLKGHKLFLASMKEIIREFDDVMLVIVGDSPAVEQLSMDDLKTYAAEIGIADRVVFTSERRDAMALMKSFDILVHPSNREAFGRVIMEAMVLGVAVVATACGGPSEIIENERSGFLVDVGSQKQITDKVRVLLQDEALRTAMGKNGQQRIRTCFDLKSTVNHMNELFDRLLNKKQAL